MQEVELSFSQLQEPVHYDWENAGTATYTPTPYSSESQPQSSSNTQQESQVQVKKQLSYFPSSTSLFQNIQLQTMPTSLKKPRKSLLPRLQKNQREFEEFVQSHLKSQRPVTTKYIVAHTLLRDLETLESKSEERYRAKSAQGIRRGIKLSQPYLEVQSESKQAKEQSPRRLKISDLLKFSRRATVKSVAVKKTVKKQKRKVSNQQPRILNYKSYSYRKQPEWQFKQIKGAKNSQLYGDFTEFRIDNSDSFLQSTQPVGKKSEHKSHTLRVELERKIPRVYSSNSLLQNGKSYIPSSLYEHQLIRRSPSVLFKGFPMMQNQNIHSGFVRRLTGRSTELR